MTATDKLTLLESSTILAPITALEFLGDDCLLAGEGPNLSVFCLEALPKKCVSLCVLQNYSIHGIRPNLPDKNEYHVTLPEVVELAVFGGKAVQLVKIRPGTQGLAIAGVLMELPDWILDVSWLQGETGSLLGVCLAHNALLLLEPDSGNVLALCSCVEVCLLYSALLIGPSWESSVLIGGTVFNQIVLWRPEGTRADGQSQVKRRLLGHNGVIFSVCYLQKSGWLASASDDRSVRVWLVGKLGADGGCGEESPTCLRVLYGHQARVFCVRLTTGCVFSAGEDGTCLLWEWKREGKVGHTLKGHRSGGIRSLAVSKESGWVATGGADGGIRLWRLLEKDSEEKDNTEGGGQTDLKFSGQGCPKVVRSVGEHGDILVCTDQGEVFLYCNAIWDLVWNGGLEFKSYCVMEVACMKSQDFYTDIWLCAVGNLTGGIHVFPLCQPKLGIYLQAGKQKVHTLQWVQGSHLCLLASGSHGVVYRWIAKMIEDESGQVLRLEKLKSFVVPPCTKRWLTAAVTFPHGKESLWVCGDRRGSVLLYKEKEISGEGKNKRTIEERPLIDDEVNESSQLPPVSVLFGVHGKQGVTSVSEHHGVCYTTGRDGCVRVFTIKNDLLNLQRVHRASKGMEWLEKVILISSDIPETQISNQDENKEEGRMEKLELDSRLVRQEEMEGRLTNDIKIRTEGENEIVFEVRFVMVGFRSVHFILWDQLKRETLFSTTCGGGHRSWTYIFPAQTPLSTHTVRQGTLIFIKQGSVMMSNSVTPTITNVTGHTLRDGLYGRGLSSVCHLGSISNGIATSEPWDVFATGGEDTLITVFAVEPKRGNVKVLAVIADHISNVRALSAVQKVTRQKGSDYRHPHIPLSTMLFSAGGRAQLQCYQLLIDSDGQTNEPFCQVTQVAGHRLDEQWERKRNRHKTVKMDPETRYMSIAVVLKNTEEIILALSCSDGAVRLFSVQVDRRTVRLLWESFYHQRCVLSAASCSVEDPQGKRHVLLFSGATDGAVALWDLTTLLDGKSQDSWHGPSTPCFSVSVHQSGVNAILVLKPPLTEDILTVVSGGDDGQLSVIRIKVQFQQIGIFPELLCCWSVALAHSSSLTALSALSSSLLVSTSPDQRVCVWSVGDDGIHHQTTTFSHTADAAGLSVWHTEGLGTENGACVVVCGQGLQILKFTEREPEVETQNKHTKMRWKVTFGNG